MAKIYCGIDLGTTNSTVSVIRINDPARDDPKKFLKTCAIYQYNEHREYERNQNYLPSAIYFDLDRQQVFTGSFAKQMYMSGTRPMQTVRSIKTRLGGHSVVEIPGINQPITSYFDMVQCSALLLKTMKQSIESQLEQQVDEVVVTVPAAFNTDERQATINAILLAGFKQYHILDEPTAALLYYLNSPANKVSSNVSTSSYKLIYDIGGGTLDVTIAKISLNSNNQADIDIVARSPRMDFAGDNFDQYIAGYFLTQFEQEFKSLEEYSLVDQTRIISKLVSHAEKTKVELNQLIKQYWNNPSELNAQAFKNIKFEVLPRTVLPSTLLNKNVLDAIFGDVIKAPNHTAKILEPIKRSLLEANLTKDDIDEVLLTGGMSRFYAVEECLRSYFGQKANFTFLDPSTSVSKGATLHHYSVAGNSFKEIKTLKVKDRMSDDIYIKVGNKFKVFIARTQLNQAKGTFDYDIPENGLTKLPIFLYTGNTDKSETYLPLSGQFLKLHSPLKQGEKIKIYWEISSDKLIKLSVGTLGILEIDQSNYYSPQDIKNNPIQKLIINPIDF